MVNIIRITFFLIKSCNFPFLVEVINLIIPFLYSTVKTPGTAINKIKKCIIKLFHSLVLFDTNEEYTFSSINQVV